MKRTGVWKRHQEEDIGHKFGRPCVKNGQWHSEIWPLGLLDDCMRGMYACIDASRRMISIMLRTRPAHVFVHEQKESQCSCFTTKTSDRGALAQKTMVSIGGRPDMQSALGLINA